MSTLSHMNSQILNKELEEIKVDLTVQVKVHDILEESCGYDFYFSPWPFLRLSPFDKRFETVKELPTGSLCEQDYWLLLKHGKGRDLIVDLGTYCGLSAALFAFNAKQVITIDGFFATSCWADMNMYNYESTVERLKVWPNVKVLKGMTQELVSTFEDRSIDLAFVDTEHEDYAVRREVNLWSPKLKENGIFIFHDFTKHFPGVVSGVLGMVEEDLLEIIEIRGWCVVTRRL